MAHKGILSQRQRPTPEALQATVLRKSISTLSIASDGEFPVSKFVKSIYFNLKIENLKKILCNVIKIFLRNFFEKGRLLCHTIEGRSGDPEMYMLLKDGPIRRSVKIMKN